jgi:hypothetical protein
MNQSSTRYHVISFAKRMCRLRQVLFINLLALTPLLIMATYIKMWAILGAANVPNVYQFYENNIDVLELWFSKPLDSIQRGLFARITQILWCLPIAINLFTVVLLKKYQDRKYRTFLWMSSIFLGILLLDDIFRYTLYLYSYFYLSFQSTKSIIHLLYAVFLLFIVVRFRQVIKQTPWMILVMAIALLLFSAAVDTLRIPGKGAPIILEDGCQFLSIVNFGLYYWQTCEQAITHAITHTLDKNNQDHKLTTPLA